MYCRDNWIKYSFDGLPRRRHHENLHLEFTQQATRLLPLPEAAKATAREIYDIYGDIYVAMSGGADSEFVAKSFVSAGIPFRAIMMTCEQNFFYGEWYVDRFCRENSVELIKYEVTIEDFLDYVKKTTLDIRANSWFATSINLVAHEVQGRGGYMVTGAVPAYVPSRQLALYNKIEPNFDHSYRGFIFDEADFYIDVVNPDYHPWAFLYWSPEMLASLISAWDTTNIREDQKTDLFGTIPRPKLGNYEIFFNNSIAAKMPGYLDQFKFAGAHEKFRWGTRDFFACPDKEPFLSMLLA